MGRNVHDHFCLLIFGQGVWKDTFTKKISKDSKYSFFHLSGYSTDSLSCTCVFCNALVKLYDPSNPGEYVEICDLCKALHDKFKEIQGVNEGIILFSHQLMRLDQLQGFAQNLVSDEHIKKIFVLEIKWKKNPKPAPAIIETLSHEKLNKSEFLGLKENQFNYHIIYEISKDKYY